MSTAQPLLPKTSIFESLARNPKAYRSGLGVLVLIGSPQIASCHVMQVSRFISTAAEAKDDPKLQETLEKLKPWVRLGRK